MSHGATRTYTNLGAGLSAVITPTWGDLCALHATNENAGVRFLQLFDRATALSGGEVPKLSFPIAAGTAAAPGALILDSGFWDGRVFNNLGIVYGFSTTEGTYTAATDGEHSINVLFT